MSLPLLVTKTYRPLPHAQALPRHNLCAWLDAALENKLTLLCAPAGFGKTTLLSAWLDRLRDRQIAWLTLEASDNDPYRFWAYVLAALQQPQPGLLEDVLAALQSPAPPPLPVVVSSLINAVATRSTPLLLVLDDYHVIRNEAIHGGLNDLLDHLPAHGRVVLTTREDPPLALARRRARGELAELRAANLRFDLDETAALLNAGLSLGLSPDDLSAIYRRTEGWAAGLHLAALSLQSRAPAERQAFVRSFSGNDQFIFDYLMDEVFRGLPQEQQDFMLLSSPLERLSVPLCQAVTGLPDSAEHLQALERANLFVQPMDNQREWYRFHPLFADLLRKRLAESRELPGMASLQQAASRWHESSGQIPEAVQYAAAAGDDETTAQLLERHVLDTFYRSEIYQVHEWLKVLPEAVLRRHPLLAAMYGNTLALLTHSAEAYAQAESWLVVAEARLAAERPDPALASETEAYIAKFRAYLAGFRGAPPEELIRLAEAAMQRLPAGTARFRSALSYLKGRGHYDLGQNQTAEQAFADAWRYGLACADWFNASAAAQMSATLAVDQGQLEKAEAQCRSALEALRQAAGEGRSLPPMAGILYITLGNLHYEWNALEDADRLVGQGQELLGLTNLPDTKRWAAIYHARIHAGRGDVPAALASLQQAGSVLPQPDPANYAHDASTWLMLAWRDPRCAQAIDAWAAGHSLRLDPPRHPDIPQLTLARWLVTRAAAQPPELMNFLEGQARAAEERERPAWLIEALVLQALAHQVRGRILRALDMLQRALEIAATHGYTRTLLDFGRDLLPLLRLALEREAVQAIARRLLAAFEAGLPPTPERPPESPARSTPGAAAISEPLSARENDVLRLLAEGLTNRQVAARLHLSPNTVRIHASSLYAKLGVGSRSAAVARARQLGYLD